jgi:hypothetical protein
MAGGASCVLWGEGRIGGLAGPDGSLGRVAQSDLWEIPEAESKLPSKLRRLQLWLLYVRNAITRSPLTRMK